MRTPRAAAPSSACPTSTCSTKGDAGRLRLHLQRFGLVLGHDAVLGERAGEAADVAGVRRGWPSSVEGVEYGPSSVGTSRIIPNGKAICLCRGQATTARVVLRDRRASIPFA